VRGKEQAIYPACWSVGDSDPLRWSDSFAWIVWRLHPATAIDALASARRRISSRGCETPSLDALSFINDQRAVDVMAKQASAGLGCAGRASWWLALREMGSGEFRNCPEIRDSRFSETASADAHGPRIAT
jgi:hypothetical protein